MDLHPDFRDLLAEFVRSDVRFVLIGGYAVGLHGKPRATKDMDLLISAAGTNLQSAARALDRFGAPPEVIRGVAKLQPEEVVYLGVAPVRIDILREADGVETEAVIDGADLVDVGGLTIPVMGLADLILNKQASGRPQDLADVALLERVRERRRR